MNAGVSSTAHASQPRGAAPAAGTTVFALLDDSHACAAAPTSRLYEGFVHEHRCDDPRTLQAAVDAVDADLAAGRHAVVLADYEWGARLLGAGHERLGADDAGALRLLVFERCTRLSRDAVDAWLEQQDGRRGEPSPAGFVDVRSSVDRAEFDRCIAAIHAWIAAGETYQVNYTYRLMADAFGTQAALYRRLRARQPVAFGAWVALPDGRQVLSCSPELFVRHDAGRLTARPMKGTARRQPVAEGDSEAARWLEGDAKNRAENLMIVDLLRNDIGRIAATGSVRVPALFALEPYRTVLQMTSTIEAAMVPATSFAALLRALFPCGSVTGAPKHHTMRLISRLESTARGLYTGAIGWLDAPAAASGRRCGDFCLSVAIRTLVLDAAPDGGGRRHARLGVGAGIVADSVAADEWDECIAKASFATGLDPGFTLLESMRASRRAGVPLLDAHLARLQRSAAALGFAFDAASARHGVAAEVAALPGDGDWRLRLELHHDGRLAVTASPLAPLATPVRLRLAPAPLRGLEASLLQHKTSLRGTYDAAIRDAEAQGAFDTLFFNPAGELTEGARSSVFVLLDGVWLTPPLACGLLPGVMRAQWLADRHRAVRERALTRADLERADRIVVCNALRGALDAQLAAGAHRPAAAPAAACRR